MKFKKVLKGFKSFKVILVLLFFILLNCFAQEQKVADSLAKIYQNNKLSKIDKMELLRNLAFNETTNLELSLQYAEELIALSAKEKNYLYLYHGYSQKGNKLNITGDFRKALDANFKSANAAIKAEYLKGEGLSYTRIADAYSNMKNSKYAELYYKKSIQILRKSSDSTSLALALLNAGDEYSRSSKFNLALEHFNEAGSIFRKEKYRIGVAYTTGNMGVIYAKQGIDDLAIKKLKEAIALLEELKDYYGISDYLSTMADIYHSRNDSKTALVFSKRSLELAQKMGLKEQASKSSLLLSELYQKSGNIPESFYYYKNYIIYRDSIDNLKAVDKTADLRANFEISKKQVEVDLMNQQKKNQRIVTISSIVSLILVFIIAVGLFRRYLFIKKTNIIIEEEKNRSDNLLMNILPEETAFELKQNGKVIAKRFDMVSVLFTDFVGFTEFSEKLDPEKLVESIDYYFSKFDEIIEKYDLEKIKTSGDSYMCAGGLPFETADHAHKMIHAAQEILDFVNQSFGDTAHNKTRFEIRIGINTGTVVAGVVGTKKFAYDIWGDTVNIASRMETNSLPGKINISENTYQLIKESFDCEYRGEVEVKNRGIMKMYFVNG